ncbi:MAG TPA: Ig-like domain-containing protein [Candidatus Limnocylindrales bacterium]|nr:Ig-like domain-containing protein [Candidatus Limnocylindrales bacterium]
MLRKIHHHLLAALLLTTSLVFGLAQVTPTNITAESGSYCPPDIWLSEPQPGSTLIETAGLQVTTTSTVGIQSVQFYVDYNLAGNGSQIGTSTWGFALNTPAYPNGFHQIYSVVNYYKLIDGVTSVDSCRTNSVDVNISNASTATSSSLEVIASIPAWRGPTNTPVDIALAAVLVTGTDRSDVTQFSSYEWKAVNVGRIDALQQFGRYNSGPTPGDGSITVRVVYSNLSKTITIPVSVYSVSSPTATSQTTLPSTTASTTTRTSPTTKADPSPLQAITAKATDNTSAFQNCMIKMVGQKTYQDITEQERRLSYQQFAQSEQCFAGQKYVIPAKLAPVAPSQVKSLPVTKQLAVQELKTISGNGKEAIKLSGTAAPGKRVIIYLFSEPLILSTKADNEGRWTYTLEDPLEPGKHEAYVTVEGEDTKPVRSSVFNFAVATAAPSDSNPLGLSYKIESTDKATFFMNAYLIGSALIILTALGGAIVYMKHRHKASSDTPSSNTVASDPPL